MRLFPSLLCLSLLMPVIAIADGFDPAFVPAEDRAWVEMLQKQIQPGLRRADVEKLLPHRAPGRQSVQLTRYLQDADYLIEVPFDQTGGSWDDNNRVAGPIVIKALRQ